MIVGTVESICFWRQCCTSALLSVSITAPKRMLFNSDNFWWFPALFNNLLFSATVLCFSTVEGYNIDKKSYSTVPIFDAFRHCLAFFVFRRQCCTSALLMASTTVPKQRLFITANFWCLLAQLKVVLFFGGKGVLGRCWWLVLQCRYNGCSLRPIFDNYWHCWKFFYFFLAAMLYFGTVER